MPAQHQTKLAGVAIDGVLLGSGKVVDLNGNADSFILDADGNTHISAPTDNQIDISVNGADDFTITANTLTALSGSTIATNTIAETTAASGVTIDGVLIKDTAVLGRTMILAMGTNGAVTVTAYNQIIFATKVGVLALSIVDPTATTHDGVELTFIATTANANTLSNAAGSGFFDAGGASKDVATFGGAIGDGLTIVAYQGKWYIKPGCSKNITLG